MRERIAAACERARRDPAEVTLVAITKGRAPDRIGRELLAHGQRVLGENRLQEWREKHDVLGGDVEWHLVGHLQRNKVRHCRPFALIHSLDSPRLARALDDEGRRDGHVFRVLLQVNVAREAGKFGVSPTDAPDLVAMLRELPHVRVEGLMTMAPYDDDPEASRGVFRELRRVRDTLGLVALSMGMSGDFEVAVEEGATLVRVGSALFGQGAAGRSGHDQEGS